MEKYVEKYQLKREGLDLEIEDPKKAIKFYKYLLNHKYFINDFFPYRRLVLMYKKTKEYDKKVNTIRCFFKSGIYCNKHHFLWFRNKLRLYSKKGFISDDEINELTEYFENNSIKNKDKANTPLPIADRLKQDRGRITIISEENYDKSEKIYELEEIGSELKRQEKYQEFIELYNYMINDLGYRSYRYYKSLCIAYRKVNDLDNELKIINQYYAGNTTKTDASDKWFDKRREEVLNITNSKAENDNTGKLSENDNLNDIVLENEKIKKEIESLKKQISNLEKRINLNEQRILSQSNNMSKNDSKQSNKNILGFDDNFIYEFPITENLKNSIAQLEELYEYDSNLSEEKNILHKIIIKEHGRLLITDKKYTEAIAFHENLKNNTYFTNDWYPYRQLTIIYDKQKNYRKNLENIKNILLSNIYLNKYQYIWFTNKIRNIMNFLYVNEDNVQDWLDYYDLNGSKNKDKLNIFLADQFTKSDETVKVLDRQSFDYRQETYGLQEIGMIYERDGNYELAIAHYKNIIDENKYNIFKFYQRICLCYEKLNDFYKELDAIKLYYTHPPKYVTEQSDEWFEKRLKMVNEKLGTSYTEDSLKI